MNVLRFLDVGQVSKDDVRQLCNYLKGSPITPIIISEDELKLTTEQNWILEIELYDYKNGRIGFSIFDRLSDFVRSELINGNGTVFVNNSNEGTTNEFYDHVQALYRAGSFPIRKMIFSSACLNLEESYEQWKQINSITDTIELDLMAYCAYENPANNPVVDNLRKYVPSSKQNRPKMFLNFNRMLHPHRILAVAELHNRDLLKHGYVSLFEECGGTDTIYTININSGIVNQPAEYERCQRALITARKIAPLVADYTDGTVNMVGSDTFSTHLYEQSYFSLVSATQFFSTMFPYKENVIQFNEKPLKPIIHKHPFIIIGAQHYIRQLKKYGYKTFSPWIDESYDEIENDMERLDAIMDEVKRLCNTNKKRWDSMIKEMEPTLNYNYKRYRDAKAQQYTYELGFNKLLPYTVNADA